MCFVSLKTQHTGAEWQSVDNEGEGQGPAFQPPEGNWVGERRPPVITGAPLEQGCARPQAGGVWEDAAPSPLQNKILGHLRDSVG